MTLLRFATLMAASFVASALGDSSSTSMTSASTMSSSDSGSMSSAMASSTPVATSVAISSNSDMTATMTSAGGNGTNIVYVHLSFPLALPFATATQYATEIPPNPFGRYQGAVVSACSSVTALDIAFTPVQNQTAPITYPYTIGPSFWAATSPLMINSSTGNLIYSCTVNASTTSNYICSGGIALTSGSASTTVPINLEGPTSGWNAEPVLVTSGQDRLASASMATCSGSLSSVGGPSATGSGTASGSASASASGNAAAGLRVGTSAYQDGLSLLVTFAMIGIGGVFALCLM